MDIDIAIKSIIFTHFLLTLKNLEHLENTESIPYSGTKGINIPIGSNMKKFYEPYLKEFKNMGVIKSYEWTSSYELGDNFWIVLEKSWNINDYFEGVLVKEILNDKMTLIKEIEEVMQYSPTLISTQVETVKSDLEVINKKLESNELFKPFLKTIKNLENYVLEIEKINGIYNIIYKNLIKPVRLEGTKGIKTTTVWAIVSIVLTSIASILINIFLT